MYMVFGWIACDVWCLHGVPVYYVSLYVVICELGVTRCCTTCSVLHGGVGQCIIWYCIVLWLFNVYGVYCDVVSRLGSIAMSYCKDCSMLSCIGLHVVKHCVLLCSVVYGIVLYICV